jgi:hypothetical protein
MEPIFLPTYLPMYETYVWTSVGFGFLNFFPHNQRIIGSGSFQKKNQRFYERTGKKRIGF